ncbi:hypothetical protein E2562_010091 [Oryza meyeriana var. granulata]|uniref:Bulb-type lectin domain-containing protein n=1 Tax=Oryza meyeriana var. granulata TaxID=110450 RepID=A0A6G1EJ32_9ORYZ|nr:hypothetical protein E2562_010091 [Oryza meyeriana var. granulata]
MSSIAILLLLVRLSCAIAVSPSSISRSTEQQIIATVTPAVADAEVGQSAQPFLTSPSGLYAAYLRRAVDSSAGGPGADACYVQIQQVADGCGGSVWESECTLVGGADACELAFSPVGLELFAGGHSLWDTGIDAEPGTLGLDDGGDMRIVSKDGVTVWQASGEPWTGQQCGVATPPASSSPSMDVLPPPSTTTSAKLLTPPASTLVSAGSSDLSFGDQLAPPADALPGSPDQPPVDTLPDQPLLPPPPPPADATPASPDLPLPPPPADTYPISPDQPLYSSPPPAPTAFVPHTPLPPVDVPPLSPPSSSSGKTPGDIALPPAPTGGMPHQHRSPHQLPLGASPPPPAAVPDTLAPSGGHGAAGGLPFGQGQQQGAFGQHQLLNGAGQPLEDSSGERPRRARTAIAVTSGLVGLLVALVFGF